MSGGYKRVPSFWQDTDFNAKITYVKSDHPDYPTVREFSWVDKEFCDQAMDDASAYIKELESGRINFRAPPPEDK